MSEDPCPRCQGTAVAALDAVAGIMLRPRHCKAGVVHLTSQIQTCLACGFVWSTSEPRALRTMIQSYGNELARQRLDELDRGPFRDLPDSDAARAAAAAVAEIDALIFSSRNPVRHYRELRGVTWDQAHKDVRDWPNLTREQKLELFGWSPKRKKGEAPDPDFDAPFP